MTSPKRILPGHTALFPAPVALVSAGTVEGPRNIITVSWIGTLCSQPPMVGMGIRPTRHSHGLIRERGEFVVNLPGRGQLEAADYCGCVSGAQVDKFARAGLTPASGEAVAAPLIAECPVNLECKLRQIIPLGSHDLFLGEVVRVHLAEGYSPEALAYSFNEYWSLGQKQASHGFAAGRF